MKLTESLHIEGQQALIDEIIISAVKQGIIKDPDMVHRPEMVHHLVVCLGEANNPRKKIVEFREGVIIPNGNAAYVLLNERDPENNERWREVKTSVPQTPYVEGKDRLTWFETINTLYIMTDGGTPVQDLRQAEAPRADEVSVSDLGAVPDDL